MSSPSSSFSRAALLVPASAQDPQGNARFMTCVQSSSKAPPPIQHDTLTCILVGGPVEKRLETMHAEVRAAAEMPAAAQSSRLRRVFSSSASYSSSNSALHSDYSYTTTSDRSNNGEKGASANDTVRLVPVAAVNNGSEDAAMRDPPISDSAALSPDPYTQVQQELRHPRVTMQQLRKYAEKVANGGTHSLTVAAVAGVNDVPGWWSCESSVLPDGSTASSSTSSSSFTPSPSIPLITATKLQSRGAPAAEVRKRLQQHSKFESDASACGQRRVAAAGDEAISLSSGGCPTGRTCRADDSKKESAIDPLERCQHHRRSKLLKRDLDGDDTNDSSDASVTGTTSASTSHRGGEGFNDTHRCSGSVSSSYSCSCCRQSFCTSSSCSCVLHKNCDGSSSDTALTLCSSCEAAARTRVLRPPSPHGKRCLPLDGVVLKCGDRHHREDRKTPFLQHDVLLDAVRDGALWKEVPPLLHLSIPSSAKGPRNTAGKSDATVLAERERAQLRAEYIRQASLLAAGGNSGGMSARDKETRIVDAVLATPQRCATGTQTEKTLAGQEEERREDDYAKRAQEKAEAEMNEKRAEQWQREARLAEEHLKGLAAAQCAEVAIPMMQRELESYETRVFSQQQQQLAFLLSQLRECQDQIRNQESARTAELQAQRVQWEEEQQRRKELEELRTRTSRRDVGTFFGEGDKPRSLLLIATQGVREEPIATEKRVVGTQHSDGTLEQLAVVQSQAAAWVINQIFVLEEETRSDLEATESEARHSLLHLLEEPSRRVKLKCQGVVLQCRQQALLERDAASLKAELRVLQLQEAVGRQELTSCSSDVLRNLWEEFQRQRSERESTVAQENLRKAQCELVETQQQLTALKAEHQDTLEHVRQLRLQLIHALRMPTVTFTEAAAPTRAPPHGAALLDAVYVNSTVRKGGDRSTADDYTSASNGRAEDVGAEGENSTTTVRSVLREMDDFPVHRRFARAHQEALRVVRAQCRTV